MKLKQKTNGTFDITGLTKEQVGLLFHFNNFLGLPKHMPPDMAQTSKEIFDALEGKAYISNDYHVKLLNSLISFCKHQNYI